MTRHTVSRGRRWTVLAVLLATVLVAGCSSGATTAPASSAPAPSAAAASAPAATELSGKIVFLERWPEPQYAPFWTKVVADYLALHPSVQIDHQAIADQPYKDKIRVLTAGGQLPDIYFSWAGDFAKKFVRAGLAADLTSEVQGTAWGDSLAGAAVNAWTYDGKVNGIPISVDGKFFLYNTKLFADNNVAVPQTLDELITACDTLKSKGIQPITFGNKDGWAAIHYMTSLNAKYVAKATLDKDYDPATGAFTDPGYLEALKKFATINTHCLTQGANGIDYTVAQAEFMLGKAAMYYGQSVEFKTFITSGGAPAGFENSWDFFPMPAATGGAGDQNSLTGAPDGFIVNAKSTHLDIAIDFMKFLTNKANGEAFTTTVGRLSSVSGTATEANAFPQLIKALDVIDKSSGYNIWLDTVAPIDVANAYLAGVQGLLDGSKTPEQISADVQAAATKAKAGL
jgi:raffinose/stachyose/melibiose transport system substrate-binding protein